MPSLSEATRVLLQRIKSAWSGVHARSTERAPSTDRDTAAILNAIGDTGAPEAIPALLEFLPGLGPGVEEAAALAIHRIVEVCDPLSLARLDGTVRRMSDWRWPALRANDVLPLSHGHTGTLGVLSFNASGHAREAAVRALADVGDGRELPFLLIRLNDWVEPVRDAARRGVVQRIQPDYSAHFIRCLPLVYRLQRQIRQDHRPVFDSVMDLLRSDACRPALREAMKVGERGVRRLAFRVLVSGGTEDRLPVLAEGLASNDTVIRLWAAREIRTRLEGDPLRTVLDRLKRDRFMPVRREALYAFVEKLPEAAPDELRAALLDPHPSLREAARFFLRKSGEQEFATFYRERLDSARENELPAVVAGLGETGAPQDAARLLAYFTHRDSRVRRISVRAVGRLDPESHVEPLLSALQDESGRVTKEAQDALRPKLYLVPPDRLWSIFQGNRQPHVRRAAVRLIARLQWWDSAPLLLEASGSDDESVGELARGFLRRWTSNANRLSVKPSNQQLESLDEALSRRAADLEPAVRSDLISLSAYAKKAQAT